MLFVGGRALFRAGNAMFRPGLPPLTLLPTDVGNVRHVLQDATVGTLLLLLTRSDGGALNVGLTGAGTDLRITPANGQATSVRVETARAYIASDVPGIKTFTITDSSGTNNGPLTYQWQVDSSGVVVINLVATPASAA